jgi:prepilin-type N-terminal cleavage/methylation domain-containing protein
MIPPFAINAPSPQRRYGPGPQRGYTLVEVMVAMGVGMLALAAVAATTLFCLRSFAGIYNYSDLNASSRLALDTMSREIRGASYVDDYQPSASHPFIRVVNTNTPSWITNTFTWDPGDQTLTWDKTGEMTNWTLLTKCTNWTCTLLERYPSNNYSFPDIAPKPGACKIVDVRWSCFRTILGIKMNSETEQGAQIVLRN